MHIMPYHDDLMIFFSFTKIKVQPISSIIDALFFFFTQVLKYHGEMCVKTCFLPCTRVERPGAYHDQIGIQHEKFGTFTAHYCLG